jgi:hypothetical protein
MRITHLLKAAMVGAVFLLAVPTAADAHSATCIAVTTLDPPTNFTSRAADGIVIETWDFTGVHGLCLADGTNVEADLEGHVHQVRHDNGTGTVVVQETMSIPTGTLKGLVVVRFSPTSFDATAVAFGGTGELSRVSGKGTTQPTGPNTFLSEMVYRYN